MNKVASLSLPLVALLSACTIVHDEYPEHPDAKQIVVFNDQDAVASLRHVLVNWSAIEKAVLSYDGPEEYQLVRACLRSGISLEALETVQEHHGESKRGLAMSVGDRKPVDRLFTVSVDPPPGCAGEGMREETFAWMIVEERSSFRVLMYLLPLEE